MTKTVVVLSCLLCGAAQAQSFPEVGAKALGFGGAFVAVASGPTAAYWNPAAMVLNRSGASFVYGRTTADPEDLSSRLDDLAATRAQALDIGSRTADGFRAIELLGAIAAEPDPIAGSRPVGVFYGGGQFGLSAYRVTLTESRPEVDLSRIELSTDPARGLPFNASSLVTRSLRLEDYVASLSGSLGDPRLLLGGSVRYSRGETRSGRTSLFGLEGFETSDVFDLAKEGEPSQEGEWSFDASALLTPHPKLRLGIIGKYLGTPRFGAADGTEIRLEPRWRSGIAVLAGPRFTIAADLDLSRASLTGLGEGERDFALGGEATFAEGKLALRGGFRDAVQGPRAPLLSGGMGLLGAGFTLDAAVGYSPRSATTTFAVEIGFAAKKK